MSARTIATVAFLAASSVAAQQTQTPAQSPRTTWDAMPVSGTFVIRNATIVPMVGARITNGSVVIQNGKIAAVGASVQAPADATAIDGSGLFVYPGMIDSGTRLGLEEIASVPGSTDTQEVGEFNPHDVTLTAVNPHSELIPVDRTNGITTVITSATGNVVSGQAALIDLLGWTPDEMAVKRSAAMVMTYPRVGGGRGRRFGGGADNAEAMSNQVRALHDFFKRAIAYADAKGKSPAGVAQHTDLAMEAMVPVVRGDEPVIFDVETAGQIRGVLALVDSFHIKPVLRGAQQAWMLADTLASRHIPVIVGPTTAVPDGDAPYDEIYANPGVLAKAGVTIAFQTSDAADARNLPYNAALATAYGLDPDEAMRAITINPAKIWGVSDKLGSLEPGKVANVIVTTGDPLDVRSTVKYLFIRGQMVPLVDRHTRLYEEFKARPKPKS
jgi:imidazolonepropionase-like amidohydrolase